MRIAGKLRRREDGATLIVVAAGMVVFMVFAAFALDLAAAWVERRQDQSSVDVADLSAAQFTIGKLQPQAMADVESEVRRISAINFGTDDAQWNGCTDPAKPAEFTLVAPGTPCVSFTPNLSKIRVRAPDQEVETKFASVVGINDLTVSAFAEVVVQNIGGRGGVLPFGIPVGDGAKTEVCLKTGQHDYDNVCDGPDSGNFGTLDFRMFGSEATDANCKLTGVGQGDGIAQNVAHGVDHDLGILDGETRHDHVLCDTNVSGLPNTTETEPGFKSQTMEKGFLYGVTNGGTYFEGRLTRGGGDKVSFKGAMANNVPLWDYLVGTSVRASTPCSNGSIANSHDNMIACIDWWKSNRAGVQLFTVDLGFSTRFAWVPYLSTSFPGGQSKPVSWTELRPVYVQTLAADCKNNNPCNVVFDPGEAPVGDYGTKKGLDAITAIQLPKWMLDTATQNQAPGSGLRLDYLLDR